MRKIIFILFIGVFLFSATACTDKTQKAQVSPTQNTYKHSFTVAGSGSNLPLTGKLIEGYSKRFNEAIEMPSSIGSGGAIKAVDKGAIDLGLTSRPLKKEEIEKGLKELPYAKIGVIIGVNKDVPDTNLTYDEYLNIYKGEKTTWQNGKMIVVLTREDGDSSIKALTKEIPGFEEAFKKADEKHTWQTFYTDAEMSQAIVKTPSAIGLTDTSALIADKLEAKPLNINGIEPTAVNIKNGKYNLSKDLYFVYKEPLSNRANQFLNFVFSSEGKQIMESNGAIPLKGKE